MVEALLDKALKTDGNYDNKKILTIAGGLYLGYKGVKLAWWSYKN